MAGGIKALLRRTLGRERLENMTTHLSPRACRLRLREALYPGSHRDIDPAYANPKDLELQAQGIFEFKRPKGKVRGANGEQWRFHGWAKPAAARITIDTGYNKDPVTCLQVQWKRTGPETVTVYCRSYAPESERGFFVTWAFFGGIALFVGLWALFDSSASDDFAWTMALLLLVIMGIDIGRLMVRNPHAANHHDLLMAFVAQALEGTRTAEASR